MKRLLAYALLGPILVSCAAMPDRPTVERMDRWFSKPKYVIEFESEKAPSLLIIALKQSNCQGESKRSSLVLPAGQNIFVPVSAQVHFRADYGNESTGMEWASLNFDSWNSRDSVMAVRAYPLGGGSRVLVAPVRQGIDAEIKASLESGSLFCDWYDFVNKWRM